MTTIDMGSMEMGYVFEDLIRRFAEQSKTQHEGELAKPEVYSNPENLEAATTKYNQIKSDLEEAQIKWETIAEEIDLLEG